MKALVAAFKKEPSPGYCETPRKFVDSSIFQVEEGVPGHGEQGHPGGDSVPDLRGPQLPGGGGDLLHAAQPGAGGRGGQEVRGGRHLDQPPQPQVSCDWWTAGHVTQYSSLIGPTAGSPPTSSGSSWPAPATPSRGHGSTAGENKERLSKLSKRFLSCVNDFIVNDVPVRRRVSLAMV